EELQERWIAVLSADDCDAASLCATAAVRRSALPWRISAAAADRAGLLEALRSADLPGRPIAAGRHKAAFVVPGQGSQWSGMGREMMQRSTVFRETIDECGRAFRAYLDWDFAAAIAVGDSDYLTQIDHIQPALFAMEVALARTWESLGVTPDAVIGHSMGE